MATPNITGGCNAVVETILVNEILCFVQQKCDVMAMDDLCKICLDFYSSDEIETARSSIMSKFVNQTVDFTESADFSGKSFVNQKQLPKQKGQESDVCLHTVTMTQ